jgi:putative transposase
MVVQDKKQGRGIRICVDLRNLNDACLHDPFPTPFTNEVLENVGGHEAYSFTDGFLGYHQIKIAQEDRHKITFATEWGSYQYTVMPFGLKNAPTIFSRVVIATFKEFIHQFLEVCMDDWTFYSLLKNHVEVLRMMLELCRQCQISLNTKICIFRTPFRILLGHIVCK